MLRTGCGFVDVDVCAGDFVAVRVGAGAGAVDDRVGAGAAVVVTRR